MIHQVSQFVRQNALLLIVLALIVGGYFFLRTSPSDIASMEALEASLRRGQPTLIEFYSNVWSACLLAKPIVDGLERELGDRVQVLRLNVLSPVGRSAANAYAVRAMPTFVLFNAKGEMVYYQMGFPGKAVIRQEIDKLEREWEKVPIYEYRCRQCAEKFEKFVRSSAAAAEVECPKCHSAEVKKVFSVFGTSGFSTASPSLDSVPGGSCNTGGGWSL